MEYCSGKWMYHIPRRMVLRTLPECPWLHDNAKNKPRPDYEAGCLVWTIEDSRIEESG